MQAMKINTFKPFNYGKTTLGQNNSLSIILPKASCQIGFRNSASSSSIDMQRRR
jgi:hypothetical protein